MSRSATSILLKLLLSTIPVGCLLGIDVVSVRDSLSELYSFLLFSYWGAGFGLNCPLYFV